MQIVRSRVKAFRANVPLMDSVPHVLAVAGVAIAVTLLVSVSALAASGRSATKDSPQFFQGVKTCSPTANPPLCVITTSNLALLQGASVLYFSVPPIFADPAPGRIDSDVLLTTADHQSTAYGHCTFYFSTGTGLCTYDRGTHKLAGFRAVLVIGTLSDTTYSVIGKYLLGGDSGD